MPKIFMPLLLGVVIFLTPSCTLFTDDATPAMSAATHMEDIGVGALDTVTELISNATGLDPVKKAELLRKAAEEKAKLLELSKTLRDLLSTYGSVDWQKVATDAYDMYIKYRSGK